MSRTINYSISSGIQKSAAAGLQEGILSAIDPYSLLGIGAALTLYDSEEEVARFISSAVTAALQVKFGAVALLNGDSCKLRVFGQFSNAALQDSLAKEIENFLSTTQKNSDILLGVTIREISVQEHLLPQASAIGLGRFLLVRLRTLDHDFGVVLAGKSSDEPYLPVQTASLEVLASQASIALHRIQLNKERAANEAALRESEERFHKIFDHSNDSVFVIDPQKDKIIDANSKASRMLGYSREELLSMSISAIHPNEMPKFLHFTQSIFEQGSGWTDELTCLTKSGNSLSAEISASVIDLAGKTYILALIRDITERKKAEQALRESEERLSRILVSAMDAIITINQEKRIVLFNEAAEKVFRCPSAVAIGQPLDRYLSESLRNLITNYMKAFGKRKKSKQYMWAPEGLTARRADGEEFPIEATISQVEVSGQKLYTVILRDINERQKAEAELNKLQLQNIYLQEEIKTEHNFGEIVGTSAAMKKVYQNIQKVATTDSTVLLTGETGTGKELIAHAIHNLSSRKDSVLVKVNCGALPSGLVESELFGHEKGAFTGAITKKKGRFELADGGTIFLDEIGELLIDTQTKLLRVLQEQEFERVGGTQTLKVNVRVIAASNRNVEEAVKHGAFRADLYYRLNIFPIHIPALRERIDDIPLLTNYFVRKFSRSIGKRIESISPKALEMLMNYDWPGNVRELANILERAVILCEFGVLEPEYIGIAVQPSVADEGISTLEYADRQHILKALEKTGGIVGGPKGAAKLLGMNRSTLLSRMKKLGIDKTR